MKSLKLDLQKLSPEAIDRIIEAVRNAPAGNVIVESVRAEPLRQLENLEHFIAFWRKVQSGAMSPSKNEIDHTVSFLEKLADITAPPAPVALRERAEPFCEVKVTHRGPDVWAHSVTFADKRPPAGAHKLYTAPPAPVVPDNVDPSLNAMMRALDAFFADEDVPERAMLAAFKILMADVRSQAQAEAPKSELAQRASQILADATELANRISDQVGNEYQQFASLAGAENRNIGIKDLVSSEIADFFAGDATKFVDGKLAAEMQKEIMKRIATCFYAE